MNALLAELDVVVAQGIELAGGTALQTSELQEWLAQRGQLFAAIDGSHADLAVSERETLRSLIEDILYLDVTILAKVQLAMGQVIDELASVQKLKAFLANGVTPAAPSFLRRTL